MRQSLRVFVVLALCVLAVKAQEKLPLRLIATTPMPGFTGDFDHFGLDLKGNRLFLAAEIHKTVEVFDLQTGGRTHSIVGFGQPLMMVYLLESNHLVVRTEVTARFISSTAKSTRSSRPLNWVRA